MICYGNWKETNTLDEAATGNGKSEWGLIYNIWLSFENIWSENFVGINSMEARVREKNLQADGYEMVRRRAFAKRIWKLMLVTRQVEEVFCWCVNHLRLEKGLV